MMIFNFDIQERMTLQRKLLKKVNSAQSYNFSLHGLSQSAIQTWKTNNQDISENLIFLIEEVSDCLLTLSTKSQESIDVQDLNLEKLNSLLKNLDKELFYNRKNY